VFDGFSVCSSMCHFVQHLLRIFHELVNRMPLVVNYSVNFEQFYKKNKQQICFLLDHIKTTVTV